MNENCDVVYYTRGSEITYKKNQVKVPVWFKKDADPKYICYCNKVTEDEIYDAVINKGAKNMKDIINLTGAMRNEKCEINNPLGKCCGSTILKLLEKVSKQNII